MFIILRKKHIYLLALLLCAAIIGLPLAAATYFTVEDQGIKLPVLMYHHLLPKSSLLGKYVITPDLFEQDLIYIKENGYETVTVSDLINYVYSDGSLPEKPIMITFDDGYRSVYEYAYPLLEKYGMRAMYSIVGDYTQQYSDNGDKNVNYAYITWQELSQIANDDVLEIASHSFDLHQNTGGRVGARKKSGETWEAYTDVLKADDDKIKTALARQGIKIDCFAFPFGAQNVESDGIMKDLGYTATLSCEEKMNFINKNPLCLYHIRRYNRPYGTSTKEFFRKFQ